MHSMSTSLEEIAGEKLKDILKYLTNSKFKAILSGIIVTAIIQSSSALSVLLIAFMNASLLPLKNAVWTVMGADIGTSITAWILTLNIGALAPLFSIIGVICLVFTSHKFIQGIGGFLVGFGFLFMGMEIMSVSMEPLTSSTFFFNIIQSLNNPLIAIITGTIVTAIIQSSSASIGILQILTMNQIISFHMAAFVVFGQNIGTCITSFLASLTGCKNAKRLAIFQVSFNIIGTVVFTLISLFTPFLDIIEFISLDSMQAIALLHTLFNVITTLLVIPIHQYVLNFIYFLLPHQLIKEI